MGAVMSESVVRDAVCWTGPQGAPTEVWTESCAVPGLRLPCAIYLPETSDPT